jgi:nitrous oxidase accessory protein
VLNRNNSLVLILLFFNVSIFGNTIKVRPSVETKTIQAAIKMAHPGDTIIVQQGIYKEKNLIINKQLTLIGINYPVITGEKRYEVVSIKSDFVSFSGFRVKHSGFGTMDDPAGIKIYDSDDVSIFDNIIEDNFFGIYLQYATNCKIFNNRIRSHGLQEQEIGNGIHCWKSDSIQIIANTIEGHRDGIYFEFVTNSIIWRNISLKNLRYGLHFMFSHNDAYIANLFKQNGAGVAVMFTHGVKMYNNTFTENWGDAAYGLLLKEISDSYIEGNVFDKNTMGIFIEGASRVQVKKNIFSSNGWAIKIQASSMDVNVTENNFFGNTFDVSTNGSLVLNKFNGNYWDKYTGYDLNRDKTGDIPFHPINLYSMIIEKNPPAMILFRSIIVNLLDQSEKVIPSLTPENLVDETPIMKPLPL